MTFAAAALAVAADESQPSFLDLPYVGPSRVPLPSVYELIATDRWGLPPEDRDRSRDLTDAAIVASL